MISLSSNTIIRFVGYATVSSIGLFMAHLAVAQDPAEPIRWDDSSTQVYLGNVRTSSEVERYGWYPVLRGRLLNAQEGNQVVVTVKQGSRVHGTGRCPVRNYCDQRSMWTEGRAPMCGRGSHGELHGRTPYAEIDCDLEDAMKIEAEGDMEFVLEYEDANTGNRTPIRTLQVPIVAHSYMISGGTRSHTPQYMMLPYDMLLSSYIDYSGMEMGLATEDAGGGQYREHNYFFAKPSFHFYTFHNQAQLRISDLAFRCTKDGQPITLNQADVRASQVLNQAWRDRRDRDGSSVDEVQWGYSKWELTVPMFVMTKSNERVFRPQGNTVPGLRTFAPRGFDLVANPGSYSCTLVASGNPIRRFDFAVDAEGIVTHPAQAAGEISMTYGRYVVETTVFPNIADELVDRDASRRSLFFGRSFPTAMIAMRDALPSRPGLATRPARVPGGRGPTKAPRRR